MPDTKLKTIGWTHRILLAALGILIIGAALFAIADVWFGLWFVKFVLDGIIAFFQMF